MHSSSERRAWFVMVPGNADISVVERGTRYSIAFDGTRRTHEAILARDVTFDDDIPSPDGRLQELSGELPDPCVLALPRTRPLARHLAGFALSGAVLFTTVREGASEPVALGPVLGRYLRERLGLGASEGPALGTVCEVVCVTRGGFAGSHDRDQPVRRDIVGIIAATLARLVELDRDARLVVYAHSGPAQLRDVVTSAGQFYFPDRCMLLNIDHRAGDAVDERPAAAEWSTTFAVRRALQARLLRADLGALRGLVALDQRLPQATLAVLEAAADWHGGIPTAPETRSPALATVTALEARAQQAVRLASALRAERWADAVVLTSAVLDAGLEELSREQRLDAARSRPTPCKECGATRGDQPRRAPGQLCREYGDQPLAELANALERRGSSVRHLKFHRNDVVHGRIDKQGILVARDDYLQAGLWERAASGVVCPAGLVRAAARVDPATYLDSLCAELIDLLQAPSSD